MGLLSKVLTLNRIVSPGIVQSKKKALELIADTFCLSVSTLDKHDIFDGLAERERLGTTAIGHGVAIPHCRSKDIDQPLGCFILLREGVDFDAEDHLRVDLLFALVVPLKTQEEHLELLAAIAALFSQEPFRRSLYAASSREELYQKLINA